MRTPSVLTRRRIWISGLVLAAFALAACLVWLAMSDPELPLLFPERGATWIQPRTPTRLEALGNAEEELTYRASFALDKAPQHATLVIRALRDSEVRLDGRLVLPYSRNMERWKQPRSVDLAPLLTPGSHEIRIAVRNEWGPAVLLAYSDDLGIRTGPAWAVSSDGQTWGPVRSVGESERPAISNDFGTAAGSFVSLLPFQAPLFLVVFLATLFLQRRPRYGMWVRGVFLNPSRIRWLLIAAWVVLAANNITKIPLYQGFDVRPHYDYIKYVALTGIVPLPTDGWQMFQSPLYYLISAALQRLLSVFYRPETVEIALRIVPLLCGTLQVEACYRAMRYVTPDREDLQIMGTTLGGLMPMSLYISQYVGNEPLAGILGAATIVASFALVSRNPASPSRRYSILLGILLGLAVLAKATSLLLVPLVVALLAYVSYRSRRSLRDAAPAVAKVIGLVVLIAGWYHLRNWMEVGKPFMGGWDPARGISWWQEPGYRIPSYFFGFGEALSHPVYAACSGFWDSIYSTLWADGLLSSIIVYKYRPPWHYGLMYSGVLLALLPTAAILLGLVKTLKAPSKAAASHLFAAACLLVYFATMLYLYATLPIYSTAKATYTLALLPCYAAMAAVGFRSMMRGPIASLLLKTLFACWAVNAYLAFFV